MALGSEDIKKELLRQAESEPKRKELLPGLGQISAARIEEDGNNLEEMTKTLGWAWVEFQVTKDVVDFATGANPKLTSDEIKGETKIMQRVKAVIFSRDEIIRKRREKEEVEKKEKEKQKKNA